MLLEGIIDERNQLWVDITVAGKIREQTVRALVDTGFTGELQLPLTVAVPLGLELAGVGTQELADGSRSEEMFFNAAIRWGTKTKPVTVSVSKTDTALLGGGLLHGYVLLVDFEKKVLTVKEPGTDEPIPLDKEPTPSSNESALPLRRKRERNPSRNKANRKPLRKKK